MTIIWNGPDLDAGFSATASWATVTDSDASAGIEVTATDCTDSGGNTNWNFGAAAAEVFFENLLAAITHGVKAQTASQLNGVLVE